MLGPVSPALVGVVEPCRCCYIYYMCTLSPAVRIAREVPWTRVSFALQGVLLVQCQPEARKKKRRVI